MGFDEFADLGGTGFEGKEIKAPEDEFFHSIYISGKSRKNHLNIIEQQGTLQIRGVDYNKQEINMIITHVKTVLVKTESIPGKDDMVKCFSYQLQKPWKGTCGKECGKNSAERSSDQYCANCKSNIIIAGILCSADGRPVLKDGEKIFVFLRGKGVKYGAISDYMTEMYKLDLDPMFPVTEESKRFEKSIVNHKRFVTTITVGNTDTKYGIKDIFSLKRGKEISKDNVNKILQIAKDNLEKFNDKFDWSRTMNKPKSEPTGYTSESKSEADIPFFGNDDFTQTSPPKSEPKSESKPASKEESFSFEDLGF